MAIYRIRNNLAIGERVIERGTLERLDLSADKIARLEEVGAISRIAAPPLAVLPGWEARSNRLEKLGIITVEDLLDAEAGDVAKKLRLKAETVKGWQTDVIEWMRITPPQGG